MLDRIGQELDTGCFVTAGEALAQTAGMGFGIFDAQDFTPGKFEVVETPGQSRLAFLLYDHGR